jgi:hypothetical protein
MAGEATMVVTVVVDHRAGGDTEVEHAMANAVQGLHACEQVVHTTWRRLSRREVKALDALRAAGPGEPGPASRKAG